MTDEDFLKKFESRTLKAELFNNYAHLRIAWLYLTKFNFNQALNKINTGIRDFASFFGAKEKYHCTLTTAITIIIRDRINSEKNESFYSFLEKNGDLLQHLKAIVSEYYSDEVLSNKIARYEFVEPDLKSFDTKTSH